MRGITRRTDVGVSAGTEDVPDGATGTDATDGHGAHLDARAGEDTGSELSDRFMLFH